MAVETDPVRIYPGYPFNIWPNGYVIGQTTSGWLILGRSAFVLKYYNGSAWVPVLTRLKKYTGTWVLDTDKIKVFYSGTWIQVNPNAP